MKIGVVGHGFVGQAVEKGFSKLGDEVRYYDKYKESDTLADVVGSAELLFICLPTPIKGNSIDLHIIDENLEEISRLPSSKNMVVVIKSTVVPGTTDAFEEKYLSLKFVMNPEFLRENNFMEDFMNPDKVIVGGSSKKVLKKLERFYQERFPEVPIFLCSAKEAEMAKYMSNCFLATKVIFANEIFALCEKMDMNYEMVKEMLLSDPRIGSSHLEITKERGFGGKCFPKDIMALLGVYDNQKVDSSLLKTVWEKNLKIRKDRDWETIPFAVTKEDLE